MLDNYYMCRYCCMGITTSVRGLDAHKGDCYRIPQKTKPELTIPSLKNDIKNFIKR